LQFSNSNWTYSELWSSRSKALKQSLDYHCYQSSETQRVWKQHRYMFMRRHLGSFSGYEWLIFSFSLSISKVSYRCKSAGLLLSWQLIQLRQTQSHHYNLWEAMHQRHWCNKNHNNSWFVQQRQKIISDKTTNMISGKSSKNLQEPIAWSNEEHYRASENSSLWWSLLLFSWENPKRWSLLTYSSSKHTSSDCICCVTLLP